MIVIVFLISSMDKKHRLFAIDDVYFYGSGVLAKLEKSDISKYNRINMKKNGQKI